MEQNQKYILIAISVVVLIIAIYYFTKSSTPATTTTPPPPPPPPPKPTSQFEYTQVTGNYDSSVVGYSVSPYLEVTAGSDPQAICNLDPKCIGYITLDSTNNSNATKLSSTLLAPYGANVMVSAMPAPLSGAYSSWTQPFFKKSCQSQSTNGYSNAGQYYVNGSFNNLQCTGTDVPGLCVISGADPVATCTSTASCIGYLELDPSDPVYKKAGATNLTYGVNLLVNAPPLFAVSPNIASTYHYVDTSCSASSASSATSS